MPVILRSYLRLLCILVTLFCSSIAARASHIFGMDLYYNNIGANVYTVTLAVYGDCSGTAFFNLATASPSIDIYNGNTYLSTLSLVVQPPTNGVEVSPVCPAQAGNTTCTNISSTLPGIKKFIYSANISLPTTSPVWRFLFTGNMGGTSSAGRSNSITNINIPGAGSTIQLVDTLNNTSGGNSSALYNIIPTPYFCINSAANYNPAAVDPNGDNLSFSLVPAIDAGTGSSVNYVFPYSATAPLAVSTGSFSFSTTTGQLSFTPNLTQRADVVYNVRELSGGILKGTSQREMTIVVLSPCSNNPPTGSMSAASSGSIISNTQINVCNSAGLFNFHINPTDADGDTITMTASGLPTGATFTIVNNTTTTPLGTFQWNVSTATPGTYTFYINYQDRGCPLSSRQSIAYTITVLPSPSETFNLLSAATCTRNAIFTVTPGGGLNPWIINILQGSTTVHTFTGVTGVITDSLAPGTYTIRTYNTVSCYKDTIITFAPPPLPSALITLTAPLCTGGNTGSISVTGTSGTAPYLYALGAGSYGTISSFSGLFSGVYVVHIKDANGCVKDTAVTVPPTPLILANIFIRRSTCNGFSNGRVIIQAYNSVAPYTYAIGTGTYTTNDTFSNLAAGTYTFHIMNANGCIKDTTLSFVDSQYLHASVNLSAILCNGGTGIVTINGIGGFGTPYSYAYNTGSLGPFNSFTLPSGTYTFHVNDPQGCFFDTTVTTTQPSPITITTTVTNATCFGSSTGSVLISATGGTPSYTYAVDGGGYSTSATITGLNAGTHTVRVKDTNNCIYSATITVSEPAPVSADSATLQIPLCNGGNNGVINVYASGGTPGYTFAVNTGSFSSSNTFSSLSSGTYTLHIKDANGCTKDTIVVLADPAGMTPAAIVNSSLCQTLANGQVTLSVSGGTPAYTYAMGAGGYVSSPVFISLAAGSYTFHIKDANGCVKDTTVAVSNTTHIAGTFAITPALCHAEANGIIMVNGTTGLAPYTYAIGTTAYSTSNTFSSLAAGAYIFHIEDANGCIGDTTVSMTQPSIVYPSINITSPSCAGYTNGLVNVTASGGTAPYTFSLNGGSFFTTTTFTGLAAGTYTLTVKDAHNCLHDTTFTITQPAPVAINNIVGGNISCNGGANGIVTVNVSGGTPAYQYAANSGTFQLSNVLTGFTSGTHVIHIKDSHGCSIDTTIMLTQPTTFTVSSALITNPTCQGYTDGAVTLNATGGTLPYSYSTNNTTFTSSPVFSGLNEATYTFYLIDNNGCTTDTTITLTGYPHIVIDSFHVTSPSCAYSSDGAVIVYASGGVPSLTYSLSGNIPSTLPNVFSILSQGQYLATITDGKNCHKDSGITVTGPDTLKVFTNVTPNDCVGADNMGAVVASITGGTSPYYFLWNIDSNNTAMITGLSNGTYTVRVTDAHNCIDSATATILYDDCCTPYLPNAFSPNGDGKNDVFRMVYKGDIRIIEFAVYNRFGNRVFLAEYTEQGWDGTYNGEPADIGSYYYYIRLLCGNKHNKVLEFKGDVTLVK